MLGTLESQNEVVRACGRLPLALEVMGGLFAREDSTSWEAIRDSLLEAEDLGSQEANRKLWGTLQISYKHLDKREQRIFLDIVCFMLGKEESVCSPVWGKYAMRSLALLKQSSLVRIDNQGRFVVHDQLRDMGRRIAKEEPRSHVWMPDSLELLCKVRCTLLPVYSHLCPAVNV